MPNLARTILSLTTIVCITPAGPVALASEPTAQPEQTPQPLKVIANLGLTYGGETVIRTYDDMGRSSNIKTGSLVQVGFGLRWDISNTPFALAATANYHADSLSAVNGAAEFERYPIELIGYYTGIKDTQIGLGLRKSLSPRANYSVDNSTNESLSFESKPATIFEIGRKISDKAWVNVRYVYEEYTTKAYTLNGNVQNASGKTVDGSHFGVNISVGF